MRTELIEILQSKYPEYCMQHIDTADEILRLFIVSNRLTKEDLETIKEHRDLMNDVISGNYKPDSFTSQPINNLIDRIENGC